MMNSLFQDEKPSPDDRDRTLPRMVQQSLPPGRIAIQSSWEVLASSGGYNRPRGRIVTATDRLDDDDYLSVKTASCVKNENNLWQAADLPFAEEYRAADDFFGK
jgi:hypothetical protein